MKQLRLMLYHPFLIRLLHWEYWSFGAIYGCIMPVWLLLALRARSFFFFSASNPSIENGGFLMESKKKIYDMLPAQCYPATCFVSKGTPAAILDLRLRELGFQYPLIAKPDIGARGMGVKKLHDEAALAAYAHAASLDYLVQEFAAQPHEVGIFYYRYPGQEKGHISGIVKKEMLTVTGDGISTLEALLAKERRYILQLPALRKIHGTALQEILPHGEKKELVPYGNHARGAKFLDYSHLADETFTRSIDDLCQKVKGFYYGRLDIRYNTWEELRQGKNIALIELNGAGSEPTHMYDPGHSLFFAWKEIIRHWLILWRISRINHKNGIPYLPLKQGLKMMKDNRAVEQKLANAYV